MIKLKKKHVLLLHSSLIEETGGTAGIRDETLLDSALAAPFQTFAGRELYPTLQAKAARLGYGLTKNHPMVDGNKRLGAHTMLFFLRVNKIELDFTCEELVSAFLDIAADRMTLEQLLEWIIDHQQ